MEDEFFLSAISSLCPMAQWAYYGDYETINWLSEDITKPTIEEIQIEVERIKDEYKKTEYKRLRALKYPNLTVLADALYWSSKGDNSHLEAYYASCEEVKNEYPKS